MHWRLIKSLNQLIFTNSLSAQESTSQVHQIFSAIGNYIQSPNLSIRLEERPPIIKSFHETLSFSAIRGVSGSSTASGTNNQDTGGRSSYLEFGLLQDRRIARGPHVHHDCNIVARSREVSTRKRTR